MAVVNHAGKPGQWFRQGFPRARRMMDGKDYVP